jgi:ubiquinone/menaquinone biosynthesis C-methylase UbiE
VVTLHHTGFHYEEKQRRGWQNPEKILTEIGLKNGSTFIDIGCGEGFFAIPACRIVGKTGKVFALDVNDEAIELLMRKARKSGLTNLVARIGQAEEIVFCEECADVVFFGIVLHDFQTLPKVLENAKKMLKPEGLLVDLDWKKEPMPFGPPLSIRFSEAQAAGLLEKSGFQVEEARDRGLYNYMILAKLRSGKS